MGLMDFITETLNNWLDLLVSPESASWLGYLGSTLLIATGIYTFSKNIDSRHGKSPGGLIRFCFPRKVYRNKSFLHDIAMYLINHSSLYIVFTLMTLTGATLAVLVWKGLYYSFGPPAIILSGVWAKLLLMVLSLMAIDLGFYISHYLQHRVPAFWEFHKIHHTASELNPFTAFRSHPIDQVIQGNITGLTTGILFGVSDYFSNGALSATMILGVNGAIFLFMLFAAHFQHTHIWITFGKRIDKWIVSPAMHQIHHSKAPEHLDKNMGSILSIWDGIMGTRVLPSRERPDLVFGLKNNKERDFSTLTSLYIEPFVATYRRIKTIRPFRRRNNKQELENENKAG